MKTALILGLALAANAYKTEQVETTVHIRSSDSKKALEQLKPFLNNLRLDDQADDELLIRAHLPVYADDELATLPYRNYDIYKNIKLPIEAQDDELATLPYRNYDIYKNIKLPIEHQDDELATLPYRNYDIYKNIKLPIEHQDDELATLPYRNYDIYKNLKLPIAAQDDELIVSTNHFGLLGSNLPGGVYLDDQFDDELMSRPILPQIVNDDELSLLHAPPKEFAHKPVLNVPFKPAVALRHDDDETDNELHYLRDLFKPERPRGYGGSFDDDETDNELHTLRDLFKPDRPRGYGGSFDDDEFRVVEKVSNLRGGSLNHKTLVLPI